MCIRSYKEKHYGCECCHKGFTQNSNLKTHIDTQSNNLNRHTLYTCTMLRSHTGEKPYMYMHQCKCHQMFTHNHNRKLHIRTHTKEKPYQCKYCQKMFVSSTNLKKKKKKKTKTKKKKLTKKEKKKTKKTNNIRSHTKEKSSV